MAPACSGEGEVKMGHRVRCFFDIEIDGIPSGRIIFELFNDVCPKTCENFRALCTGELGDGQTTGKPLHYRGVKFHRVIKDFMIQAGDFSAGNGTGGESIYGGQFEDESFDHHHEEPFLLSMANRGKNTNGSQFFITTQPATHLDGKHVVFGRVVSGQEVVVTVENLPVDNRSRPLQPVVISNCGELVLQRTIKTKGEKRRKKKKEAVSSSDSDSDVDKKKKRKKKKKEKKQKYKKTESSGEEGEVKDDGSEAAGETVKMRSHPLVSVSIINPDEIPDVPKNRFLYRAGPENNDEGRVERNRNRDRPCSTVRAYTKSGRKVKGRGSLRYHTPSRSRSRSRSRTPPHWRQAQRRTISYEQLQKWNEEKMRREQERQARQQERDQEIEERRRRREQRHRENDEGGGKPIENLRHGSHSEKEQGPKGDWRDARDRMKRDFRDGRAPQGWRNGRERQRGEHDWREAQERTRAEEDSKEKKNLDWKGNREEGGFSHQDLRDKLHNREGPETNADNQGRRVHKHNSEKNDVKKEDFKSKQQDRRKKEKQDDFDETALDYEAMENEEEEEEEDESKKNTDGKINEINKAGQNAQPAPEGNREVKEAENVQREEQGKDPETGKDNSNGAEKCQSPNQKNKDHNERHKDKTRDKQRQSRDRPTRSRDIRSNRSGERRRNRSRDRRNRSRDRRDRSKDRRDRSRDRAGRRGKSRERRERKSRSRERTRDRRRQHSASSNSSSSSSGRSN